MQKTKLYKLIKSLSKSEFNQLEAYIGSPFFLKKNKYPLKLYLALKRFAPKFDADNLTKEIIFEMVFPKVNYSDAKMRNLLSRTVKIVDSYLLYLDNEADEFGRDKRLSEVYNKRNIESEFFNYSRRLLAKLNQIEQKDTSYYFNKFSLEKEMYFHAQGNKHVNIQTLKNSIVNFHNYVSLEQTIIQLELINRERILDEKNNVPLLTYSHELTKNNLPLRLISNINKLLRNNDINLFKNILEEFKEQFNFLVKNDSINIFLSLQNFLGQQNYTNPPLINKLKFELNQFGLKHDLMIINGYLLDTAYINIVITGNKEKKYTWVKNFIEQYQNRLRPDKAKFIKNMGLSLVYYEEGKFEDVVNLLANNSTTPSIIWVQNVRTLQIRSLFNLFLKDNTYYKSLLSHCDAFEKFLKREKLLSLKRKTMSLNFLKIMRRLGNTINRKKWNEQKRKLFITEVEKNKMINSRVWLQNVLKEI